VPFWELFDVEDHAILVVVVFVVVVIVNVTTAIIPAGSHKSALCYGNVASLSKVYTKSAIKECSFFMHQKYIFFVDYNKYSSLL